MGSLNCNMDTGMVIFTLLSIGVSSAQSPIVCTEEGFHPHPSTCSMFYRCIRFANGLELVLFQCAPGTIWLPGDSVCAHLEGDGCTAGTESAAETTVKPTTTATPTTTTPSTTTPSTTTTATTSSSTSTTPLTTTSLPATTSLSTTTSLFTTTSLSTTISSAASSPEDPKLQNIKCKRSGIVAHGDCRHFWLCFWVSSVDIIEAHLYQCPEGEIFSVNGHTCQIPRGDHSCSPTSPPPPPEVPVNILEGPTHTTYLLKGWGLPVLPYLYID